MLKSKVDHYALAATFLCLSEVTKLLCAPCGTNFFFTFPLFTFNAQIFLVVYQMKYSSTQALASRLSYLSIFAQSLLDANLCLMHLLLSFAFPSVFFASFIWISILKLLQFSVFHMRLIINIYQAR